MAHLDTLISMIPDEKLRTEIEGQVSRLSAKASFGLVFEEHRPETVQLPGFEITRGGKVVFKDGSTSGIWTVLRLVSGVATLVRTGDSGERVDANVDDLVVIREFGDPIYPGLQSVGSVVNGGDKPFHTVINAENFHATEMLLYPYEGKVDAIYLDPPYNTGAKDWKYNNDYVDGKDQYRHSKWLSFIEKRLRLAKRLLNPKNSVLIFTIDEKEYLRAGLLIEEIFRDCNIQMVTSVIAPQGSARADTFSRVDEYLFFVFIGDAGVIKGPDDMLFERKSDVVDWDFLRRSGSNARRQDRERSFYPIYVDIATNEVKHVGEFVPLGTSRDETEDMPGCITVWPIRQDGTEGRWQLGSAGFRAALENGTVKLGRVNKKNKTCAIYYLASGKLEQIRTGEILVTGKAADGSLKLAYNPELKMERPKTVWNRESHNARTGGSDLLKNLLPGRPFPYPKSLYAVEDALSFFIMDKPKALVVDFFGGSGTTAHAVMRLNARDQGRRRSIVVTNNEVSAEEAAELRKKGFEPGDPEWEELGIFEHITKPRIEAAVTGRTPSGAPAKGRYKAYGQVEKKCSCDDSSCEGKTVETDLVDEQPLSSGFPENVEYFKLTYEDNQLVRLGRKFEAIAPILWLRAGAEGERINTLPEDGWAMPKKGFYGVLTDIDQWEPFVDAINARDDVRCVFIVTDSQAEFEAINVQIDQSIDSVRLYSDYLQSFEINTRQG